MKPRLPPRGTVRGNIKHWLYSNRAHLSSPLLEVGSRRSEQAWWANNRDLRPDIEEWLGIDMHSGTGVDMVLDLAEGTGSLKKESIGSCLCSEVLEHVWDVPSMLDNIYWLLMPGGKLVVTTLFSFPVHGFPSDYWRFTPAALQRLLEEASFREVRVEEADIRKVRLSNHGRGVVHRPLPTHVFAVGCK